MWHKLHQVLIAGVTLLCQSYAPAWAGSEGAHPERAIFDLFVNEAPSGEVTVLLEDQDVAVKASDLARTGLHDYSGTRKTLSGKEYVLLSSLAPAITFQVDEAQLALRLTADPKYLPTTSLNLQQARPQGMVYRKDTSAFFNYSVSATDFKEVEATGEIGLSYGGHLLSSLVSRHADGAVTRGLTSLKLNDPVNLRQGIIGDAFATGASPIGGSAFLGGIGFNKEFSLDPYFFRFPVPGLSGTVLTPSTYEVYVNDQLIRRGDLQPGRFDLANLPVSAGSGNVRIITRDSFGRTHEIGSPFYLATRTLARGQHEYAYNIGFTRHDVINQSFQYGTPAFLARHRVGVLDALTLGLRVEGGTNMVSGGPSLSSRLPNQLGEVELSVATSYQGGESGSAASIAYVYWGKHLSLGSTVTTMSPRYVNVSQSAQSDRKLWDATGFIGVPIGQRASVTVQFSQGVSRDRGTVSSVGGNWNVRLTDRWSVFSTASHTQDFSNTSTAFFIGLNAILSPTVNATALFERRDKDSNAGIRIQRPLPAYSEGYGYLINANTDERQRADATLQYQGPYGRYELRSAISDGGNTTTVSAAGALVAVGNRVAATRPVTDSFAVIQVPGVEGVRGYLFNQEVGRTNRHGDLIVPNMLSYFGNNLSIEDKDIPLGHRIDSTQQILAPPLRGGVLAAFPIQRLQAITGIARLLENGQEVIPVYGEMSITAEGKRFESPLGKKGEFYFENLPPGTHKALIEFNDRECVVEIIVPLSSESFMKLGTVVCSAMPL
jgi:outer membrane usher protein